MRQKTLDGLLVGRTDHVSAAQAAFLLLRFLGQDVAVKGVATLEAAGSGLLEALGRTPVGFQLGHGSAPFCPRWGRYIRRYSKRPDDEVMGLLVAWQRFFWPAIFCGVRILGLTSYFFKVFVAPATLPWERTCSRLVPE
jgi:hypothetical protein